MKSKTWLSLLSIAGILFVFTTGCQKDDSENNNLTVADYDGNVYRTVKIGTQTWMVENLKVTHYRNGDPIPNVTDNAEWIALTTGAYCWYNNDEAANKDIYGALYNWYAVETGNLCPTGWHVPIDAEWTTLINFLSGEAVAGGKLKEMGMTHWNNPNTGATNISGFTALPGGYLVEGGLFFYDVGQDGYWWSSTEYNTALAMDRHMFYNDSNVVSYHDNKEYGFSVRCVKD
jgi:uncharacterized protein (TIGR02145 family)